MEMVDFVPVCGRMKKHRRKGAYQKLNSSTEVSGSVENVGDTLRPKVKMVEVIPKVHQPKISRLSMNIWKRLRNAYVKRMLSLAEHVTHLNNGEICFFNKIHDDDVHLLLA
ncbi:hypothetical protein PHAVU_004G153201 [Phaseolus vulgaris]|uniref:Uncharacterized protein n=1 Tax=Phaseolus vulgaris TaxID=3885 RepID=V7C3L6_PHAVU|nr:hypothetical protein PHAVU_004G153200g [Phaseolus vulgaris]ESW24709.1 hypothetical protein PHAVU_004G153200g [Phaseolus vulgaris]